ncbi:MAG: SPOR domain-containing protein [Magnetococcales bacterium]|nr:SPOR domain-containing protein [Magnetococcales bacterium]
MSVPQDQFPVRLSGRRLLTPLGFCLLLAGCTGNLQKVPIYYAPSIQRPPQEQSNFGSMNEPERGGPGHPGAAASPKEPSVPVMAQPPGEKTEVEPSRVIPPPVASPSTSAQPPMVQPEPPVQSESVQPPMVQPEPPVQSESVQPPMVQPEPPVQSAPLREAVQMKEEPITGGLGDGATEERGSSKESLPPEDARAERSAGMFSTWYQQASAELTRLFKAEDKAAPAPDELESESRQALGGAGASDGYTLRQPLSERELLGEDRGGASMGSGSADPGGVSGEMQRSETVVREDFSQPPAPEAQQVAPEGEKGWKKLSLWGGGAGNFFGNLFRPSEGSQPDKRVSDPSGAADTTRQESDSAALEVDESSSGFAETPPWQSGTSANGQGYYVQLGGFSDSANAEKMVKRLKTLNVPFLQQQARVDGTLIHKVFVGPLADQKEAQAMAKDLEKNKIQVGPITNRLE